jgi:hypothetical protein
MAVACSAGATKAVIGGRRTILESSTLSPVEAARLVQMVRPRSTGVMGIFNWSAWTNRDEFVLPVPFAEEQFRWAVGYLDPQIKCAHLRPGWELTTSVSNEVRRFDEPGIESPARLFD